MAGADRRPRIGLGIATCPGKVRPLCISQWLVKRLTHPTSLKTHLQTETDAAAAALIAATACVLQ